MPQIEITVDPMGGVTIEGQGFAGADCARATQAIREALGQQVEERRKPEYYETEQQEEREQA